MNVLYEEEGALKVGAILAERIRNSNRIFHPTTLYWPPGTPVKSHDNSQARRVDRNVALRSL